MSSKTDKGPLAGGPMVPRYMPTTPDMAVARFLMNTARRYLAEKATKGDVNVAIREWQEATK